MYSYAVRNIFFSFISPDRPLEVFPKSFFYRKATIKKSEYVTLECQKIVIL